MQRGQMCWSAVIVLSLALTVAAAPGVKEELRLLNSSAKGVWLEWQHPSGDDDLLSPYMVQVDEIQRHDHNSCCKVFPVMEVPFEVNTEVYKVEVSGLRPASTYHITVTAKTVTLGSLVVHTRPPHLPFTLLPSQHILRQTMKHPLPTPLTWGSQQFEVDHSDIYSSLVKSHIILVLLNSADAGKRSGIQESALDSLLRQHISRPFHFVAEYSKDKVVSQSKWGQSRSSPPASPSLAVLQITEYKGVYNVDLRFSDSSWVHPSDKKTMQDTARAHIFSDKISTISVPHVNMTLPTVHSTSLNLKGEHLTATGPELHDILPKTIKVGNTTAPDGYPVDDNIILHINATGISDYDWQDIKVRISAELRRELLLQFDKINTDLQELSRGINVKGPVTERSNCTLLSRVPRDLPFEDSTTCQVELTTLTTFRDELKVTLSGTNQGTNNNCPLNYNSDTCDELVKLVLCGYTHLKNGFRAAIANHAAIDEATMWKNKLNEYKENAARFLDNKIASYSQKYRQDIDKFNRDMQILQQQANLNLETIKGDGPEVCAYRIMAGKIQEAVDKFEQLRDKFEFLEEEILRSIIKTVYQLDRLENIVLFMRKLPSCNHDKITFPALVNEIEKHNDLSSPKMLIISDGVKLCMRGSSLDDRLQRIAQNVIDAWGTNIRQGNYPPILDSIKDCETFANDHWGKIIEEAYSCKVEEADRILRFIRSLPCWKPSTICLRALLTEMKECHDVNSPQFLWLAYKIKQDQSNLDSLSDLDIRRYYENKYSDLQADLPFSIRRMIWNGTICSIKNMYFNEYLYAASDGYAHDSERRSIFTWRSGGNVIQGYWTVKANDYAESFTVQNRFYAEYMYAADDNHAHDSERRRLFTWKPGGNVVQGNWILEPVNVDEGTFRIKNTHYRSCGEYLYAANDGFAYDSGRRRVFTWRGCGTIQNDKDFWEIDCNYKD